MKSTTSDWFAGLANVERKALVCMLFEVRGHAAIVNSPHAMVFKEFLARLDSEYHTLKTL